MAKIVCVEDEAGIREDITETLELAGHTVIQAENGALGLVAILKERPDLAISDVTMPEMSGHDLLRVLRESHPELADMPFVFLSALADRKDQIAGHQLGADDYLTKPVDFELMHVIINAKLQRAERVQERKDTQLINLYGALTGTPVHDSERVKRMLSGAGTMTIATVTNDEIDLSDIHAMIESQGHVLFRLKSGREFLDNAATIKPDILLIGFNTTDLQAPMVVKMLRGMGHCEFAKVLLMPASILPLPNGGLVPGFDAVLHPPITPEALMEKIAATGHYLVPPEDLLAAS